MSNRDAARHRHFNADHEYAVDAGHRLSDNRQHAALDDEDRSSRGIENAGHGFVGPGSFVDKKERLLRKVEEAPEDFLLLVRSYVGRLLDLEVSYAER